MMLAVGFLFLPALGYAQNEPQPEPTTTAIVDQADQTPAEIEIEVSAETAPGTPQTPADPLPESSPVPGQPASNSDVEKDDFDVVSSVQPGELAADQLIEESQKMSAGERYPEALEFASFAVQKEDSPEDPYSPDLIEPLLNLAAIQAKMQLDEEAAESYERGIDLIERDGGIYDARLVPTINQSGRLLQKEGKHEQAIGLFERSQHISHRADGVYSLDQVPALDRMTRSYLAIGNFDAGNAAQNFRYSIELHQYGRGSMLVVPSKVRLARFKSSIRLNDDARRLYLEAIQITENSLGENDLALVELLLGLASVRQDQRALREYRQQKMDQLQLDHSLGYYERGPPPVSFSTESAKKSPPPARIQGTSPGQALAALIRAMQIMDLHKDEVSLSERFGIHVTLGDMYMLLRKRKSGIETYMQALQLLDTEDNAEELKEQYFGRPRRLQYRKPRLLANSVGRYTNYDGTFAEASFVVFANGMVGDIEVVATNAPAPMRAMFRKEVRRSIYRPRFVDGEPVATTEHLREEFAGTVLPANAAPAKN